MDKIGYLVGFDGIEDQTSGLYVVADKVLIIIATNLGLQHHDDFSLFKMPLPVTGFGKIGIFGGNIRLNLFQDIQIGTVLVKNDDILVTFGF